ncbi:MAG TPA: DUF488 domain-containing protein [Phycisphaerae bacterium]|nr:DUF488 domain-containing protein [Phycisphaerae bacterium]HDZ43328.1 DUF488 domain-containing protein [Phycisphaerae bacterium]
MADRPTVYTIGHSNLSMMQFLGLLHANDITAVADVRSVPRSRTSHFNRDFLEATLKREGVRYVFLGEELGARRVETECYEDGQVDFEKVVCLPAFTRGIERLRHGMTEYRIALLCAEKEPIDCHRVILVARALCGRGVCVKNILSDGVVEDGSETDHRLVVRTVGGPTLFDASANDEELLEQAYHQRGKEIAYRRQEVSVPGGKSLADR